MLLLTLFVWSALAAPALAEKRVALVIGNARYDEAVPLRNPANDALALSGALERLGFEVHRGLDLDLDGMRGLIRDFGKAASGAELALFFYAGHGVQVGGKNYLLPVDAKLEEEADLDFAAIDADLVMRQLDRTATTKLVLLDACRDNPFERELARSMGATRSARSLGRGLARINATGGSLIAFATDPGDVAFDGEGRHSPFTEALLNHIETPGLEINVLMTRVRADVYGLTQTRQRPWTSSSLIGEVYLAPTGRAPLGDVAPSDVTALAPETPRVRDTALEVALWTAAETGGTAADYQAYLDQFPEGAFAVMAQNRISALATASADSPEDTTVAALTPSAEDVQTATPEEVEAALGLARADLREVQERLTILGHNTRGIDGILGPGSRAAIRAWQAQADLPATGYLTQPGLSKLRSATDGRLAAFRAEQERKAAAAAAAARQRAQTPLSGDTRTSSGGIYRARAVCGAVSATARHADRQQAMLQAARQCAAKGGDPGCCTSGITVSR